MVLISSYLRFNYKVSILELDNKSIKELNRQVCMICEKCMSLKSEQKLFKLKKNENLPFNAVFSVQSLS